MTLTESRRTLRYRLVVTENGVEYRSIPWFDDRADAVEAAKRSELPCRVEPAWVYS